METEIKLLADMLSATLLNLLQGKSTQETKTVIADKLREFNGGLQAALKQKHISMIEGEFCSCGAPVGKKMAKIIENNG